MWARGPQAVTVRTRFLTDSASPPIPNGNGAIVRRVDGASDFGPLLPITPANGSTPDIDTLVLNALLTEITMLSRQVEQASSSQPPAGTDERMQASVELLLSRIDTLPKRIADAIGAALGRQHRMIVDDIHTALSAFSAGRDPAA